MRELRHRRLRRHLSGTGERPRLAVFGSLKHIFAQVIDDEAGNHLARGLAGFDAEEIPHMLGRTSAQLRRLLGEEYAHPLVHRDNLVLI